MGSNVMKLVLILLSTTVFSVSVMAMAMATGNPEIQETETFILHTRTLDGPRYTYGEGVIVPGEQNSLEEVSRFLPGNRYRSSLRDEELEREPQAPVIIVPRDGCYIGERSVAAGIALSIITNLEERIENQFEDYLRRRDEYLGGEFGESPEVRLRGFIIDKLQIKRSGEVIVPYALIFDLEDETRFRRVDLTFKLVRSDQTGFVYNDSSGELLSACEIEARRR